MNCKNCEYGLKQSCGDFEKILCTYEEGECVKITDLEKENAELKKENKVLAQNLEDIEILNKTYEKRFNDLEKENAELKDDNKVMADNYSKMEQKFYDNLTKAKEIIADIIKFQPYINRDTMFLSVGNNWKEVIYKAEQFLQGVSE